MKRYLIFIVALFSLFPSSAFAQAPTPQPDTFFRGKVLNVIKENRIDDQGIPVLQQDLLVQIQSGDEKGKEVRLDYEIDLNNDLQRPVSENDRVVVGKNELGSEIKYYISDIYRLNALWLIIGIFFLSAIVFAKSYGLRAIAGLIFTFLIIGFFLIPLILDGQNPLLIGLITTIAIACTALYIAHGIRVETTIAFLSTIITLVLALVLGVLAVKITALTGIGTEDAFYLQFAPGIRIDLQGLLLAGIMIGVLGVLDDVTTAQTAAVAEIHKANKSLKLKSLYQRGLRVGREHIVSLVNTLVLAYTGAALPLLLLFNVFERPFWVTLNSELIMEELVRMLVGSIALTLAVPITTIFAAIYFTNYKNKH